MTKSEREHLEYLLEEFDNADDKIDPLESLLHEVRKMVNKSKKKDN